MPCRSFEDELYVGSPRHNQYVKTIASLEAMLCGIVRTMDLQQLSVTLSEVDWEEAGVTRKEFHNWWTKHEAEDAARKIKEEAAARKAKTKADALAKLTTEERKALGL
jgi:hypothetical protein